MSFALKARVSEEEQEARGAGAQACMSTARSAASVDDSFPAFFSRRCHSWLPSSPNGPSATGTPFA